MLSNKVKYSIQVALMLVVFSFVLFTLVFQLIEEMRSESIKKKEEQIEKQRIKTEFISNIEDHYIQLQKLYQAKEYDKVIEIIKVFNQYGKSDYKDLTKIKKDIRLFYLKKNLDFIPKIDLNEYIQLSKEIKIEEDNSTQVFIRIPRYGQYFYTSDFPILLEGVALSILGDFSDGIVWSSNIDGILGKGKQLSVRLSIGEHKITATGTNGMTTGTMETRIYIEKDPDFLKKHLKN
ncbi:MAG: hypothetical protein B6230_06945 [Desulfobacteraceae bacterium 4572_89]|nr:MAG: hypothetical protein B6230_06945 [Desulfobacteraceae bacterium 4572_89]